MLRTLLIYISVGMAGVVFETEPEHMEISVMQCHLVISRQEMSFTQSPLNLHYISGHSTGLADYGWKNV